MAQAQSTSQNVNNTFKSFSTLVLRGDVIFALGLMGILIFLILPLPKQVLDVSLAFSISLSILILVTTLFIEKPLEFSSFPTVLLVATMLRLSLNVASTRLILAHGHEGISAAGEVIRAFGSFVMGGNFVIGIIVFSILVIVNFVVITKGSGRIAEVSARFSLDAMPGKQMAIDADLSAGLINEAEAKARRKELEEESNFFGAMDGAAKFVRGDAIAGILITGINIVGGIIIGVTQNHMSLGNAASNYTFLTVGDGLVTQIPALIVSTAAGMLISKAGVTGTTDKALFGQLSAYPMALALCSLLMGTMSLLPGIPMIPFIAIAGATGYGAWRIFQEQEQETSRKITLKENQKKEGLEKTSEDPIQTMLHIDEIRLEVGVGLIPLINQDGPNRMTDQIKSLRRQIAGEMGFILPSLRIQDNLQLTPNAYSVLIKEIEAGKGEIKPHMLLVMDPRGESIQLSGEATTEPTFGLPAMWVSLNQKESAESKGYTVVDPATVVITHLTELIKDNMPDLLTISMTQKMLDDLDKPYQKIITEMIPTHISLSSFQRILQNLLRERISIRDLGTIVEATSEVAGQSRNITNITEHVRSRLARQICSTYADNTGTIKLVTLSPTWEKIFSDAIVGEGESKQLSMAPTQLQEFIQLTRHVFDKCAMMGDYPVLLTSARNRPFVRSIIERFRPLTAVLSQNEIHPKARLKTIDQV